MDSFPLTQKKLLQQPPARRHKLISLWLQEIHEKLLKNALSEGSLSQFLQNYIQLLKWIEESAPNQRNLRNPQEWIEFLSDRFHHHKARSGIGIAEHNFLPRVIKGDRIDSSPWEAPIHYKVALDNLRSAFNVGSIFRIADATGFEGVLLGNQTPGSENLQVAKTSMGCTGWIPQEKHLDLSETLLQHHQLGYAIIGIETVENSQNHLQFPWPKKGIIVLGNEEYGLSQAVLGCCDSFIHLPMQGRKNSVNVANAFSVVAFHVACSTGQIQ
jgi:23S rRNA (guanosine2251-2'-O)-methyltransferase